LATAASPNRLAWSLVEELIGNPSLYSVQVEKTSGGAVIIDAGVTAKGGFKSGRLITEICLGGLGRAKILQKAYDDLSLLSILVYTDHPAVAALGCQFAGWRLSQGEYSAIGSGPARALALKPKELFEEINYRDQSDCAVIVLETDRQPPSELIKRVADDCEVNTSKLAVILTPTTSLAGAIQVSGRIVETGLHKLRRLGLDPKKVRYACGTAPVPPLHPKFAKAMGRTNDAILYGGTSYYSVESDDEEELKRFVWKAPSKASKAYGKPFSEIFKEADFDFYKIDPDLFAPATVIVNNIKTGHIFKSGKINTQILKKSFSLSDV
jgi:methenyltetrahydromethanopterin cyclohydrolase